jgi:hypothetical protein
MRFSLPSIIQGLFSLLLLLVLCAFAVTLSGCRTAGPQITLTNCPGATVHVPGSTDATQGKTIPVKALADNALSAAQTGDPTATVEDKSRLEASAPGSPLGTPLSKAASSSPTPPPAFPPTPPIPPAGGVAGDSE